MPITFSRTDTAAGEVKLGGELGRLAAAKVEAVGVARAGGGGGGGAAAAASAGHSCHGQGCQQGGANDASSS